jgi:hypothetical protein
MQVWRLSSFVWTDKWLICLPKCRLSFNVCTQLWTTFLIFHISIRIKCNRISEDLMHVEGSGRDLVWDMTNETAYRYAFLSTEETLDRLLTNALSPNHVHNAKQRAEIWLPWRWWHQFSPKRWYRNHTASRRCKQGSVLNEVSAAERCWSGVAWHWYSTSRWPPGSGLGIKPRSSYWRASVPDGSRHTHPRHGQAGEYLSRGHFRTFLGAELRDSRYSRIVRPTQFRFTVALCRNPFVLSSFLFMRTRTGRIEVPRL